MNSIRIFNRICVLQNLLREPIMDDEDAARADAAREELKFLASII